MTQELIDRLTERCEAYKGQVEAGASEIDRLTAEVERLRATLDAIEDYDVPGAVTDQHALNAIRRIAREALGDDEQTGER